MTSISPGKSYLKKSDTGSCLLKIPRRCRSTPDSARKTRVAVRKNDSGLYGDVYRGATLCSAYLCTQSALMRKRVSSFMEGKLCPVCHGKRLKPESLSVTFAGVDIGEFMQMPLDQLAELLLPISGGFQYASCRG